MSQTTNVFPALSDRTRKTVTSVIKPKRAPKPKKA